MVSNCSRCVNGIPSPGFDVEILRAILYPQINGLESNPGKNDALQKQYTHTADRPGHSIAHRSTETSMTGQISPGTHTSESFPVAPEISVILPVYNGENTLEKAVYSLGCLKKVNAELVIVDDGSSDGTSHVAGKIQSQLGRDRVRILSGSHRGVVDAANRAIDASRGRWIARMDADDWSSPHRLRRQLEYARQHNLDVVSSLVKIVSPDGHPVLSLEGYENWLNQCLSPEEILAARFIELPIPNPTILAKREVFELKYRHGNFPEDYDMWLRAAACGFRIGKVPRTLYWWTDHPNRLTRNQSIYTKAAFINAKKEHLVNGPLQGVTQCDFWGAGAEGKSWILWFQKLGIHIRTLVDVHPGKIGQTIHGIPVISPDQIPTAPLFPIFIAVGVPEGRRQIHNFIINHLPHTPGQDAWFLA